MNDKEKIKPILHTEDKFEDYISKFSTDLAKRQKPLGPEERKILEENLWDLYGT